VLHDEEANDLKGTEVIEYGILVGDTQPIMQPQYTVPYDLGDQMKTQVGKILTQRIR
jgi:hypothetical protein